MGQALGPPLGPKGGESQINVIKTISYIANLAEREGFSRFDLKGVFPSCQHPVNNLPKRAGSISSSSMV